MPGRTEALKRAQKKYIDKFTRVEIRMTPGARYRMKEHAKKKGESVSAFVNRAILETMERDKAAGGEIT